MDVSIEIRDEMCRVSCTGPFNSRTFTAAMEKLVSHPGFVQSMDCLWDCRRVDATTMLPDDTRQMADYMTGPGSGRGIGRTAVVVEGDLGFGMTRMYDLRSQGSVPGTFSVFRTMEHAEEWLSAPAETPP